MKIKDGFLLKKIAGSTVVVPVGDTLVNIQQMLSLNQSGAIYRQQLQKH